MSTRMEYTMESTDGKSRLHILKWLPDSGNPKAVLQIAHGVVEHIGRYDDFANFMCEGGYAVVGNSHLGHGRSYAEARDKGFFAEKGGWFTAVDDMRRLYDRTHEEYPSLPYFLLGHSMGSFMSRSFLIRYPDLLSGCILSGTGQQSGALLNSGLVLAGVSRLLFGTRKKSPGLNKLSFGAYCKRIPSPRTPYDWLSRDQDMVDKYIADDDCGFIPSIGLFSDMLGGIRFIGNKTNIDKMRRNLPVLLVSGTEDPVGEYGKGPKKVFSMFKDAGLTDVTLKFYDGARHEILNETNRREVYGDIRDWLDTKILVGSRADIPRLPL